MPPDSQDSSSSGDESEDVDWEALSQEFVESDDSPEVRSKKRDKDGVIKITSMAAKKRLDLEGPESTGADPNSRPGAKIVPGAGGGELLPLFPEIPSIATSTIHGTTLICPCCQRMAPSLLACLRYGDRSD